MLLLYADAAPCRAQAAPPALAESIRAGRNALGSPDRAVRVEGAWRLGRIGPPAAEAVPALAALLGDHGTMTDGRMLLWARPDNPWAREVTSPGREAARALVRIGPAAVDPLLGVLADNTNREARVNAAWALGELGEPRAVPLLTSHANIWRPESLEALARIGDASAAPALLKTFNQSAGFVAGVVDTLVALGPACGPAVLAHYDDPRAPNRPMALRALGRIGLAEALPRAVAALSPEAEPALLREALGVLARSPASPKAGGPLAALAAHPDWRIRRDALDALGRLGDPARLPAVLAAFTDTDPAVRGHAALAAGAVGDTRAADALAGLLVDRDRFPRRAASAALVALGDPRALDGIDALLRDGDAPTRSAAAGLLARWGTAEAATRLAPLTMDAAGPVRRAARGALRELGATAADPYARYLSASADDIGWDDLGRGIDLLFDLGPAAVAPAAREFVGSPTWQFPNRVRARLAAAGEAAVAPLTEALRGREAMWKVVERVAGLLAELDTPRAVPPLIELLEHPSPAVRKKALAGLRRITGANPGGDAAAWRAWKEQQP